MNICNQLEKLVPPPFVTVKTEQSRSILSSWFKFLKKSKYEGHVGLLTSEIHFLNGFIVRKGTQLRLEKALLLTNQVLKLCLRWKKNDLKQQLTDFGAGIGNRKNKGTRLPSSQWGSWILYLMLRDSALLAKIKLECENTTKYWLGLISSAHHWGDSLVITGILSRIWHLCSIILQDLIELSYPTVIGIKSLLQSTNSLEWPNEEWVIPDHIYPWLRNEMNLSFERARLNVSLNHLNRTVSKSAAVSLLSRTFESNAPSKKRKLKKSIRKGCGADIGSSSCYIDKEGSLDLQFKEFSNEAEDEDLGVVVKDKPKKSKKKTRNRETLNQLSKNCNNWLLFQKYWKAFSNNCPSEFDTRKQLKMLLLHIKHYRNNEKDGCQIIRERLMRLIKTTRLAIKDGNSDTQSTLCQELKKYNIFIKKKVKALKSEENTLIL